MVEEFQLVQRAREGDIRAFRELFDRSRAQVYRLAYDLSGDQHTAEDLSQDTFMKAFRSLSGFRGDAKLSTWLHRITVNIWLDQRKANSKKQIEYNEETIPGGILGESDIHQNPTPVQAAEASLTRQHIEEALSHLAASEREVFVMRHYHDMRLKDIAASLSIAEGTVKSHLFRALRKMQHYLSPYRRDYDLENNL